MLPNFDHEAILCGMLRQPDSTDVLNEACDKIHAHLIKYYGFPRNQMPHGLMYEAIWAVYLAGERRGIAREQNPVSALFPVPTAKEVENAGD